MAADSKSECVAGPALVPNLSKEKIGEHGQANTVALKRIVVSRSRHEQLSPSRKTSKSVRFTIDTLARDEHPSMTP